MPVHLTFCYCCKQLKTSIVIIIKVWCHVMSELLHSHSKSEQIPHTYIQPQKQNKTKPKPKTKTQKLGTK